MVHEPPTPYLEDALERAERAVKTATPYAPRTRTHEPLTVGDRYLVVPDLTVWRHGANDDATPALVVELRSDSTDRYALGIKRLAYQTARIPEYWFIDPRGGIVQVMRLQGSTAPEYGWPPDVLRAGDVIRTDALGGAAVAVVDLLPL
jgi:Uma2 family endonuclease